MNSNVIRDASTRRRRFPPILAGLVVAALAACGGDGKSPDPDTTMQADTTTGADTAQPLQGVALRLSATDARACELIVADPAGVLGPVTFPTGVEGRALREGPKVALAFTATADIALPVDGVELQVSGGAASAGTLEIRRARCFDRWGKAIDRASATVGER